MTLIRTLAVGFLPLVLASCATNSIQHWQAPLYQDHLLLGSVWKVSAQEFVSQETLIADISNSDILLLGEKHDNPDHHLQQREILASLHGAGLLSSVSFEMLDSSQEELLFDRKALGSMSDAELQEALRWDAAGWDWMLYGPVVRDVLRWNISLRAANISAAEMRAIYANQAGLELEEYLNVEQVAQLTEQVDRSHCGMLPASQFSAMVRVQQARDFSMANSLDVDAGVAVLIAGNFHIRKDLGVPNYIENENVRAVSVALIEVSPEHEDPRDYVDQIARRPAYDYIWFSPAVTTEDYCDSLRSD